MLPLRRHFQIYKTQAFDIKPPFVFADFNPYYHGTTSRRRYPRFRSQRFYLVSILIITELHLEVLYAFFLNNRLDWFQSLLSRNYISKFLMKSGSLSFPMFQSLLSRNYISKSRPGIIVGYEDPVSILIITELHLEDSFLKLSIFKYTVSILIITELHLEERVE